MSMVWPTLGSRTAKEQNRTRVGWYQKKHSPTQAAFIECYSNHIITQISIQTAGLAFGGTGLCSYRVRGVDSSCAKHLTVEYYTVVYAANSHTYYYHQFSITHSLFHSMLKTFLHPSCSSDILYQFRPSTTIHSILLVQFTYLTVLYHNLSLGPLWSSSWSRTHYFILHTFVHPIITLSQHIPTACFAVVPMLSHHINSH